MLSVNMQFLTQITFCIQNWRDAKLKLRILQFHVVIFYVLLPSEQLFPKFTGKKLEVELRKIDT